MATKKAKLVVEYARSNRSKCRWSNKTIQFGEVRLGRRHWSKKFGGEYYAYFLPEEFQKKYGSLVTREEDLVGFSALQPQDQDALRKLFSLKCSSVSTPSAVPDNAQKSSKHPLYPEEDELITQETHSFSQGEYSIRIQNEKKYVTLTVSKSHNHFTNTYNSEALAQATAHVVSSATELKDLFAASLDKKNNSVHMAIIKDPMASDMSLVFQVTVISKKTFSLSLSAVKVSRMTHLEMVVEDLQRDNDAMKVKLKELRCTNSRIEALEASFDELRRETSAQLDALKSENVALKDQLLKAQGTFETDLITDYASFKASTSRTVKEIKANGEEMNESLQKYCKENVDKMSSALEREVVGLKAMVRSKGIMARLESIEAIKRAKTDNIKAHGALQNEMKNYISKLRKERNSALMNLERTTDRLRAKIRPTLLSLVTREGFNPKGFMTWSSSRMFYRPDQFCLSKDKTTINIVQEGFYLIHCHIVNPHDYTVSYGLCINGRRIHCVYGSGKNRQTANGSITEYVKSGSTLKICAVEPRTLIPLGNTREFSQLTVLKL
mmetsp:Transcript_29897/g.33364  ORF Transcript_29897/g.33364 Transcript_29897/m.33364 type:complete len:553 (-) Transcript_29897:70-1728(-)